MAKVVQRTDGARIKRGINQHSDVDSTSQTATNATADSLDQRVGATKDGLILGKYKATGSIAIIALVAIVICYFAFQYLAR